jgi:hypothetical protein
MMRLFNQLDQHELIIQRHGLHSINQILKAQQMHCTGHWNSPFTEFLIAVYGIEPLDLMVNSSAIAAFSVFRFFAGYSSHHGLGHSGMRCLPQGLPACMPASGGLETK